MATFPLSGGAQFPDGTSVSVYPRTAWSAEDLSGGPSGSAAGNSPQTIASGSATFTGLTDATDYVAYANVGGQDRYRRFTTRVDAPLSAGSSTVAADLFASLKAAVDQAHANGGGVVSCASKLYDQQPPITWYSNVTIQGVPGGTVIRLQDNAPDDLIKSERFDALTGTNKPRGSPFFDNDPADQGISRCALRDVILDGNKANQTQPRACLSVYGFDYELRQVRIRRAKGVGLRSEWGSRSQSAETAAGDSDQMEAQLRNVKVHDCDGGGIDWQGPHDSQFESVVVYNNTGKAIWTHGNAGGEHFSNSHTWGTSQTDGFLLGQTAHLSACQAEGATGYQITVLGNGTTVTATRVYAGDNGIKLGDVGVPVTRCLIDVSFTQLNAHWLDLANDGGANIIRAAGLLGTAVPFIGTQSGATALTIATGDSTQDFARFRSVTAAGGNILLDSTGRVSLFRNNGSGYLELVEQSARPPATADRIHFFIEDDGAGHSKLYAQFGTGALQPIAVEGATAGAYRTLLNAKGKFDAVAATTTLINEGGVNSPGGSGGGLNVVKLDPADFPTGTKLRIKALAVANATAPGATFTVGLYPISGPAGAAANVTVVQGAVVAGSQAAIATPGAGALVDVESTDFDCPAAGYYAIGVVVSQAMAVNSSIVIRGTLDAHY